MVNPKLLCVSAVLSLDWFADKTLGTYTGISVLLHTAVQVQGVNRYVYRVYATFSDLNDYVLSVGGSGVHGNIVLQSRNADDSGFGTNFFNHASNPNGGITAPPQFAVEGAPSVIYDTFVTIGVAINDPNGLGDQATLSDPWGLDNLVGNNLESNNSFWFVPEPIEQGRAGHWAGNRVFIMQLTVNAGQNVRGTVAITGINADALASEFTAVNQTFNSFPTPPVFALFALGALTPPQRRRRG